MPLPQNHQGSEPSLPGAVTFSEYSSSEASSRSDSHMTSFSEEVCFISAQVIDRCDNIDVLGPVR